MHVYRFCRWETQQEFVFSMGGGHSRTRYARIGTPEVQAVCAALKVEFEELLLLKVQILAEEAKSVLNGS